MSNCANKNGLVCKKMHPNGRLERPKLTNDFKRFTTVKCYLPVIVLASVVFSSIFSSLKFGTLKSALRVTELLPSRQ